MLNNVINEHIPSVFIPKYKDCPSYLYFNNVFTHVECKNIVKNGLINLNSSLISGGVVDESIRHSSNSWLNNNLENAWIFERLGEVISQANETYQFDISHFGEAMQFTCYKESNFYKWHIDSGDGVMSLRKLSAVVMLTDPRFYEGGELQIFSSRHEKLPNELGTVIVFPSFKEHRVTPVKSGTRYSLVSWISGPPLR
jgi:PKHD-type hydroxylase